MSGGLDSLGAPKTLNESTTQNQSGTTAGSTNTILQSLMQGLSNMGSTTSGTSTSGPLEAQAGNYAELWNAAKLAQGANQATGAYGGDFIAGATDAQRQGIDLLKSSVPTIQNAVGAAPLAVDQLKDVVAGKYLDPATNPWIASVADAAVRRVQDPLMQNVLPGITDQAIAQGAYGGARQDLSQERAVKDFGQSALDATSGIYANNYATERGYQNAAASGGLQNAIQGVVSLSQQPGMVLSNAGELERGLNQLALDNALAKHTEALNAPWQGLTNYAGILGAGGFGTTTSSGATNTTQSSSQNTSSTQTAIQNLLQTMTGTKDTTKDNPNYESPFLQLLKAGIGLASGVAGIGGSQGFGLWGPTPKPAVATPGGG